MVLHDAVTSFVTGVSSAGRIAVEGASAGGLLAAALVHRCPPRSKPPTHGSPRTASPAHILGRPALIGTSGRAAHTVSQITCYPAASAVVWPLCLSAPPQPAAALRCMLHCRRGSDLAAALLRAPFVDMVSAALNPDAPLVAHEASEWGDAAGAASALDAVGQLCFSHACCRLGLCCCVSQQRITEAQCVRCCHGHIAVLSIPACPCKLGLM